MAEGSKSPVIVTLTPEVSYRLDLPGGTVNGLRLVSEWEGMRKLQDGKGRFLIVAPRKTPNLMDEIFDKVMGTENGKEFVVIAASPDLVRAEMAGTPDCSSGVEIRARESHRDE